MAIGGPHACFYSSLNSQEKTFFFLMNCSATTALSIALNTSITVCVTQWKGQNFLNPDAFIPLPEAQNDLHIYWMSWWPTCHSLNMLQTSWHWVTWTILLSLLSSFRYASFLSNLFTIVALSKKEKHPHWLINISSIMKEVTQEVMGYLQYTKWTAVRSETGARGF